jgi:uncharacterized membrane protein YfcA
MGHWNGRNCVGRRGLLVCVVSGFVTGFLSGLVGLGGSELRIPFILYGLSVPLHEMIATNLLISLFVSGLNFVLRARVGLLSSNALPVSVSMLAGSLVGAFSGASLGQRITERKLKAFIAFVLVLVLLRIIVGFFYKRQFVSASLPSLLELGISAIFGLLIGLVAGSVGVAGGEFQIPVLAFIFGASFKVSGTVSQLISIPTILVALLRYRSLGFLSNRTITVSILMGIPSVLGVLASLPVLTIVDEQIVELAFGAILLYTIARLLLELSR